MERTKKLKILITEDDFDSAFILEEILNRAGYEVLPTAVSGEEAIEKFKTYKPDLLLMDISLPGKSDGIEIVRALGSEIPVIYLTGHSDNDVIQRAKSTNPYGFILKPYDPKLVLITIDMAAHKAFIESKSRSIKRRLADTLESLKDSVITVDVEGNIVYLNSSAEKHLEVSQTYATGKSLLDFIKIKASKEGKPVEAIDGLVELIKQSDTFLKNYLISTSRSGKERFVNIQAIPSHNINCKISKYIVVIRDVSEKYYFEQKNWIFASALQNIKDGVLVVEKNNKEVPLKVCYANRGFEKITEFKQEEVYGKSLLSFLDKELDKDLRAKLVSSCEQTNSICEDATIFSKFGKKLITNWSVSSISKDSKEEMLVIILRDVTHFRKIEENVRQTQKIEAVGRLAGGVAHDFNNLLAVINSCSDLLKQKLKNNKELLTYAENIQAVGQKGAALVKNLMTFGKREEAKTNKLIDAAPVVENIVKMLSSWLGENIAIKTYYEQGLMAINISTTQLEQILMNLCVNAKDAMPNGGNLFISLKNFTVNEGDNSAIKPGGYVAIEVQDSGIGMEKEVCRNIFEPFFTTKPVGKGTGLGLSTVYGIVKKYEGSVKVSSEVGKGSKFTVFIPAKKVIKQAILPTAELAIAKRTILINEDQLKSDCIKGLLASQGKACCTLSSLEQLNREFEYNDFSNVIIDVDYQEERIKEFFKESESLLCGKRVVLLNEFDNNIEIPQNLTGNIQFLGADASMQQIVELV